MMETIEEIIEIFNIKESCPICKEKIKNYRYSKYYPYYLQNITTECVFYYPNQIYTIQQKCINGHITRNEYIPSEESDRRYRIKYANIIQRQRDYMTSSYNKN